MNPDGNVAFYKNVSLEMLYEIVPRVSPIAPRTEALVCSFSKEGEREDVSVRLFVC